MSSTNFQQQSSFFSFLSFCSTRSVSPSFRPDPRGSHSRRAPRIVKDGRRAKVAYAQIIFRPFLDRPEHGGGLGRVGLTPECLFRQQRAKTRRSEASLPGWSAKIAHHVLVFG